MKVIGYIIFIIYSLNLMSCASNKNERDVSLKIKSEDYASRRAAFKFYNAAQGCPSYNDLPGAKNYFGKVKVSQEYKIISLPKSSPIHVIYFKPNETPAMMRDMKAFRSKNIQITVNEDMAELQLITDENGARKWIAEGYIECNNSDN